MFGKIKYISDNTAVVEINNGASRDTVEAVLLALKSL